MKHLGTMVATLLASAFLLAGPQTTFAQEGKPKAEKKEKAKRDTYPFRGKVKAADKTAMTVTLGGKEKDRVITVTSETRIVKLGKPAIFEDITVGEDVGGMVKKTPEGKEQAVMVRVGPAPAKKEGGEKKKKKKAE